MKKSVIFGLAIVALTIIYPFLLPDGSTLSLDVTPDFIGFILIYLGIENLSYRHRMLRELASSAAFLAVISFLTFAAQLAPFYASFFVGETKFIAIAAAWIGDFYQSFEFIFIAVYMLYLVFFCFAFARETSERIKYAPKQKKFSEKDVYGDFTYSQWAYKLYYILSLVFAAVFALICGLCVFYHFTEATIDILGMDVGIWITFLPASILFCLYENTAFNLIKEEIKEGGSSAG